MSDRDLLVHILAHVEVMAAEVASMHEELERARPLLERAAKSRMLRLATGGMSWPTG
jgi:hypothetical protein